MNEPINTDALLLTKVQPIFRFPEILPTVLFVFWDPTQDTTSHVIVTSLFAPVDCDNSSDFVFDDLAVLRRADWLGVL